MPLPYLEAEVQFNLGQTGGTSGSPVFDHEGFIVAVSFAGIVILVGDEEEGYVRIPIGDLDFGNSRGRGMDIDRPHRDRRGTSRIQGLPAQHLPRLPGGLVHAGSYDFTDQSLMLAF